MSENMTVLALTPAERRVVGRLTAQVQQIVREHNEEVNELIGLFCAKRGYEVDGFTLQPHKGKLALVREDEAGTEETPPVEHEGADVEGLAEGRAVQESVANEDEG